MSNPVEYLILLTETERKLLVLSLENYMTMYKIHGYKKINHRYRDKTHIKLQPLLIALTNRNGGFRMKLKTGMLSVLSDALYWYSGFVPQNKSVDYGVSGCTEHFSTTYTDLSYIIKGRSTHRELFDFDPVTYNSKEDRKIPASVLSEFRKLVARCNAQNQVTRLDEFPQYSDETDVEYSNRIDEHIKTANQKYHVSNLYRSTPKQEDESFEQYRVRLEQEALKIDGPFFKVQFKDLSKLVLSETMSYFHS